MAASVKENGVIRGALRGEYSCGMDKKEIESPKLTVHFLIWISAFLLLLFALLAHFVWKVF